MQKFILSFVLIGALFFTTQLAAQDSVVVRKIYDHALTKGNCYENLRSLCHDIGGRLSGSPEAEKAVQWAKALLESMNLDTVYLQEVMVPHWVRGEKEVGQIHMTNGQKTDIAVCALGGSIATPEEGITAGFWPGRNRSFGP